MVEAPENCLNEEYLKNGEWQQVGFEDTFGLGWDGLSRDPGGG